jgi:hypothetical protein
MVFDFYSKKIKVFVSEATNDLEELRNRLIKVLVRAGMEVFYIDPRLLNDSSKIMEETARILKMVDCSIHVIGKALSSDEDNKEETSIPEFQLNQAEERIKSGRREFKIFLWQPFDEVNVSNNEDSDTYVSLLKKRIIQNMVYSNRKSDILFVEDIRSVMYSGKPVEYDVEKAELFFIYNWLDQDYVKEIVSMVADVIDIRTLEIMISKEVDYAELVVQQIVKSKLVAIYFRKTADWALPFIQQVWKKIGGASSPTSILFIGDSNIESNLAVSFDAAKVTTVIVPHEIMPVEIKVQYDKIIG